MNAAPHPVRRPLSVDDYRRMDAAGIFAPDERVELIEGEIIAMPPIGSAHQSIVDRLNRRLVVAVGDAAIVRVQGPVRLSRFSEPQPDLLLLAPRPDFYAGGHPAPADALLAIEVADASPRFDRERKAPLYARSGVAELWLLDVEGRAATRHRQAAPDGYADVAALELSTDVPLPLAGRSVDLSDAFG